MRLLTHKRKLVGYVGNEEIELLEVNGVLSSGKNSRFSEWLRNMINKEYGNKELLKQELQELESQQKIFELDKMKIEKSWTETQERIVSIKHLIKTNESNKNKLIEHGINEEQYSYLVKIKREIDSTGGSFAMLNLRKKDFNENFETSINYSDFIKLIELVS